MRPPLGPPLAALRFCRHVTKNVLRRTREVVERRVLLRALLFMDVGPNGVELIVNGGANRRFSVQTIVINRALIPHLTRFAISPAPLFFA